MLASVQIVESVSPIAGADRIELVKLVGLGWQCIAKKDLFKPGDWAIYIEIDTVIPKSLLDWEYTGEERVHLSTIKMKGQLSQGLVLPYSMLKHPALYKEDVAEQLGVTKYEKAIPPQLQGIIKGSFPGFLKKTDEERIQSVPEFLEILNGQEYYITTKLDGTSATFYKYNGVFGVCSRNVELLDGENTYWKTARQYDIESWLPDGYCIQGEICGEGIQGNKMGLKGTHLYLFNIFNIHTQQYETCLKGVKWIPEFVNFVPLEHEPTHLFFSYTMEQMLERARGYYSNGELKEGIVVRSKNPGISFKVLNNDFLLKWKE